MPSTTSGNSYIMFARVCNHVADFNVLNKCLTDKLLHFLNFNAHTMNSVISKFNVGPLREGLSETECYGDLVYELKKLIGRNDFSFQFRKIVTRYRRTGCN